MDKSLKTLFQNTALAQIVIGVLLILISASSGLVIGNFSYSLSNRNWDWIIFGIGCILIISGIIIQILLIGKKDKTNSVKTYIHLSDLAQSSISEALETERVNTILQKRINTEELKRSDEIIKNTSKQLYKQNILLSHLEKFIMATILVSSIDEDIAREDIIENLSKANVAIREIISVIPISLPGPSEEEIINAILDGLAEREAPSDSHLELFYLVGKLYGVSLSMGIGFYAVSKAIPTLIEEFPKNPSEDIDKIPTVVVNKLESSDFMELVRSSNRV